MSTTHIKAKASLEIFSSNLLRLMTQKGVDVDDLAHQLKINARRVRSWTRGGCYPQYPMMVKLCNYLQYFDIYTLITEPIIVT